VRGAISNDRPYRDLTEGWRAISSPPAKSGLLG
jgi:hypothetical protein